MRIIELLDTLGQLGIDIDEFLKRFFEGKVLFIEVSVLLPEIVKIAGHIGIILTEQ